MNSFINRLLAYVLTYGFLLWRLEAYARTLLLERPGSLTCSYA